MAYSTSSISEQGECASFSIVHHDIIEEHILSRLDGLALTSLSCTSPYFHALSSHNTLWRKICMSTWPSVDHPRVIQLLSAVPNAHRKFFSDSFPLLTPYDQPRKLKRPSLASELISAVDIWYRNQPVFSRVIETETNSGWFLHSPFRVDLLDPKEVMSTQIKMSHIDDDMWKEELEENLTLSWIIIDPTLKKSANFSNLRPVSVERHWLTGEVQVEYATVLGCDVVEFVECKVVITCGVCEDGDLHVREACMQVEDMDGKCLNGKNSLVALVNAIEFGRRTRKGDNDEGRRWHEQFMKDKRLRREQKVLRERMMEIACVAGISACVAFSALYLVCR